MKASARIFAGAASERRPKGASQGEICVGVDRSWLLDPRNGHVHAGNRNPKEREAFPESSLLGPRVIRSSVPRTLLCLVLIATRTVSPHSSKWACILFRVL